MSPVPVIPDSAPFTVEQRAWLNGYFAGLLARGPVDPVVARAGPAGPAAPTLRSLTILFGSQTGTAEGLAKRAAKEAGKRGYAATVLDMAGCTTAQLSQLQNLLVIVSTYGEGEPPDGARALHTALATAGAPALGGLHFSVCALGDTNYPQFCQCGKDFDARLEKLGAVRVLARVDCDLEYDAKFTAWLDAALTALAPGGKDQGSSNNPAPPEIVNRKSEIVNPTESAEAYSRKNPYLAPVITVRKLNGAGSAKEVNHVELSLEGSGLAYEAGDALGVVPQNCPALVAEVLAALGCDGEEAVPAPTGELPLRRALTECYDLGKPTAELIALVGACLPVRRAQGPEPAVGQATPGNEAIASKLAPTANQPHHVIDVLLAAATKPAPADFIARLRKIQPRLYSIASSPKAHPGQVHLTVGAVRYEQDGRARQGVCSTFLAERGVAAGKVGVFVHSNRAFRPPASGDTPMIMVGPGTGIAPFRAFLQERRATGAKDRNWLFFGDQTAAADYLYRDELASLRADGTLTRLDLAFSRDQAEKIYVQHRMRENAAELYAWLEAGAHFYVCGDAARMARDVDTALHEVIEQAGGKTRLQAADYVQALQAARRYARDVY